MKDYGAVHHFVVNPAAANPSVVLFSSDLIFQLRPDPAVSSGVEQRFSPVSARALKNKLYLLNNHIS